MGERPRCSTRGGSSLGRGVPFRSVRQCVGPRYGEEEMEEALHRSSCASSVFEWSGEGGRSQGALKLFVFDGRLEYGPRALGIVRFWRIRGLQRKKRLNTMKEGGMAPVWCHSPRANQAEFLGVRGTIPYIVYLSFGSHGENGFIPVHKDGTTRPQMVNERNPLLMDIVESFEKVTGISMVINTSFNRGGEPIVCSPAIQ